MFAGPTLHGIGLPTALREIFVLPPLRRGDIERLVTSHPPGAIIMVDGVFYQSLAVGHAEIRTALEEGWAVWGLSSMGAIRAYEMRHWGVRGYGRVYRCFCEFDDFRDDEVAFLHEPEPPYRAFSEPLVHIRFWLRELVEKGILQTSQEQQILEILMSMWFGDRTLPCVRSLVVGLIPNCQDVVDATLKDFDRFRVKSHDLSEFLRKKIWRREGRIHEGV